MEMMHLGLGCMGMSGIYGATDDAHSIAVIQAAIERGVRLVDTGDFYGMGHNEMLIARAIEGRRDRVKLSVKFGALRGPDNSWGGVDARPVAVKNFVAYSLRRLGVDAIDIYRPARLDPAVPIEDTIGAIAGLVKQGYVKEIGLSEVGPETIRRAAKVHPIVDLQIEYSIASRDPEDAIFPVLDELGINATLYGVLSRGLLSGSALAATDSRRFLPRFSAEHRDTNATIVDGLRGLATRWAMTPSQLAIGWARAKQPRLMVLLAPRTMAQLDDALAARPLTAEELAAVERIVPRGAITGTRYAAAQMAHLDSEKR